MHSAPQQHRLHVRDARGVRGQECRGEESGAEQGVREGGEASFGVQGVKEGGLEEDGVDAEARAVVNVRDRGASTALFYAAYEGHAAVVKVRGGDRTGASGWELNWAWSAKQPFCPS